MRSELVETLGEDLWKAKFLLIRYRVIGHLQNSWQLLGDITPEAIVDIAKFITGLSQPYKRLAIKICNRINNTMSLHFLTLLATFEANADQEVFCLKIVRKHWRRHYGDISYSW